MTPERFEQLSQILHKYENGMNYLKVARDQDSVRGSILCALGNTPQLVSLETAEKCWQMMEQDIVNTLDSYKTEFDQA